MRASSFTIRMRRARVRGVVGQAEVRSRHRVTMVEVGAALERVRAGGRLVQVEIAAALYRPETRARADRIWVKTFGRARSTLIRGDCMAGDPASLWIRKDQVLPSANPWEPGAQEKTPGEPQRAPLPKADPSGARPLE